MKTFINSFLLMLVGNRLRRHALRCERCRVAGQKEDMRYEDFCEKGLRLVKASERILLR
jgi:hypothetical protein